MTTYAFIGSLTRPAAHFAGAKGVGITICTFDPVSGALVAIGVFSDIDDPIWLSVDQARRTLYVSAGLGDTCCLDVLRFDEATRTLSRIAREPSGGMEACHTSLSRDGSAAYIANYGEALANDGDIGIKVFPLAPDGTLLPACLTATHRGQGVDADRQRASHPHAVLGSPDGRFVYVADLGLDLIARYPADAVGHRTADFDVAARFPAGSGPRHFVFTPDGRRCFAITELKPALFSFTVGTDGSLEQVDALDIAGPDGQPVQPAGIVFHPSGFILASLRGSDEIIAATVDETSGALSLAGRWPCGGRTPRDLALAPDGGHLLVSNQDSNAVSVFGVTHNPVSLSHISDFAAGTPMVTGFLEA